MAQKQLDNPQSISFAPSEDNTKASFSAAVTWQAYTSLTQQASSTSCQLYQATADATRAVSARMQQGNMDRGSLNPSLTPAEVSIPN